MTNLMGKEHRAIIMVPITKVNLKMEQSMVMVFICGLINQGIKGTLNTMNLKVMVNMSGQMDVST